jgi:hypothetical protein
MKGGGAVMGLGVASGDCFVDGTRIIGTQVTCFTRIIGTQFTGQVN